MKQRRVILCLEHSESTKMGKLALVFTKHCRQCTRLEDTKKEYSYTPFFKGVEVLPWYISLKKSKGLLPCFEGEYTCTDIFEKEHACTPAHVPFNSLSLSHRSVYCLQCFRTRTWLG